MKKHMKNIILKTLAFIASFVMVINSLNYEAIANIIDISKTEDISSSKYGESVPTVSVNAVKGYEEGGYVKWSPVEGADGYVVYCADNKDSFDEPIDDMLVRDYGSYLRADTVGLPAGNYYFKIDAVEIDSDTKLQKVISSVISDKFTVTNYDRSGFAFIDEDGKPYMDGSVGAYNADGTLKDDAIVIYLTEWNKDDVKATIKSWENYYKEYTGIVNILTAIANGYEDRPVDIRVIGCLTDPAEINEKNSFRGDLAISNNNHGNPITIEGIGDDATINGFGITCRYITNIEVRNLGIMNNNSNEGDALSFRFNAYHAWAHNNDLFYSNRSSDKKQDKGDGSIDCTEVDFLTVAYNHFYDGGKTCLLSINPVDKGHHATYHHNWYDHSDSRHPRARYFNVHVYNNYFDNNYNYGMAATLGASIFAENNYFEKVNRPFLIASQGHDILSGDKTDSNNVSSNLSKESGGFIKEYGNIFDNSGSKYTPYDPVDCPYDFDAYKASSRDEIIPETIKVNHIQDQSDKYTYLDDYGTTDVRTYSNFDTDPKFYSYKVDDANDVPAIVMANAGRVEGGDIKYTLGVDAEYGDIDLKLKSMLREYVSSIKSIGGIEKTLEKKYCKVTFDFNGGVNGENEKNISIMIENGKCIASPAYAPDYSGHQFLGWYTSDDILFDFSESITKDTVIKAMWKEIVDISDDDDSYKLDMSDVPVDEYYQSFTKHGFTITANQNHPVKIISDKKVINGKEYTSKLSFEGKGNVADEYRTIKFTVAKKSTLYVVAESAKSPLTDERSIILTNNSSTYNLKTFKSGDEGPGKYSIELDKGTWNLCCSTNTVNIYYIRLVQIKDEINHCENVDYNAIENEDGSNTIDLQNGLITNKKYGTEDAVVFSVMEDMSYHSARVTYNDTIYPLFVQGTTNPSLDFSIPSSGAVLVADTGNIKAGHVDITLRSTYGTVPRMVYLIKTSPTYKVLEEKEFNTSDSYRFSFDITPNSQYMLYGKSTKICIADITYTYEEKTEPEIIFSDVKGYEEGAYIKWYPVEGADGYVVYCSADKDSFDEPIDDMLIRDYGSYFRADEVGLSAGDYYFKIDAVAIDSDTKDKTVISSVISDKVTVTNYDRSGFAFIDEEGKPYMDGSVGAYNADGTLKDDAIVIYLTEWNKDDVKATIKSKESYYKERTGIIEILTAIGNGYEDRPIDIRVIGCLTDPAGINENNSFKGDLLVRNNNSENPITIEGIGDDATLNGFGIACKYITNVEVRNLGVMNNNSNECDAISFYSGSYHAWAHNNDLFYGESSSDKDQKKGDGSIDSSNSDFITISYNHFYDGGKTCLLATNPVDKRHHATYHHNWFDHSDQRHPRARYYNVHCYNNLYEYNSVFGIGAYLGASVFAENNYFNHVNKPFLIGSQGHDIIGGNVLVSGGSNEPGGFIKEYGNIFESCEKYTPYDAENCPYEFDAYKASSADERIPDTIRVNHDQDESPDFHYSEDYGTTDIRTYSNFELSEVFYKYILDNAEDIPEIVKEKSGRVEGGDFKYTLGVEAEGSSIDDNLKEKLRGYITGLKSIGGIEKTAEKTYCKVVFDFNGGKNYVDEESVPSVIEKGKCISRPFALPELKGYKFVDWYGEDGELFDFSKPIDSDTVIKAMWEEIIDISDDDYSYKLDMRDVPADEYVQPFTKHGFTITANQNHPVKIINDKKIVDGVEYTSKLCLNGTGDVEEQFRTIQFVVSKKSRIEIVAESANKSLTDERVISLTDNNGKYALATFDSENPGPLRCSMELERGGWSLYCRNGAVNIYYIALDCIENEEDINRCENIDYSAVKNKDGSNTINLTNGLIKDKTYGSEGAVAFSVMEDMSYHLAKTTYKDTTYPGHAQGTTNPILNSLFPSSGAVLVADTSDIKAGHIDITLRSAFGTVPKTVYLIRVAPTYRLIEEKEFNTSDSYRFSFDITNDSQYMLYGMYTKICIADITYTYEENPKPPKYTVIFNSNGGAGTFENQIVEEGQKAVNPVTETNVPTKEGYTFKYWSFTNTETATAYDFDTAVTEDLTLYAIYEENKLPFTVAFLETKDFVYNEVKQRYETVYDGSKKEPKVIVTDESGEELIINSDYIVKYANNVKATEDTTKKATVTITGKGLYTGNKILTFDILRKDISDSDIVEGYVEAKPKQSVSVMLAYKGLPLKNSDYTIDQSCKKVPEKLKARDVYEYTVKGAGNYKGNRKVKLSVVDNITAKKLVIVQKTANFTYNTKSLHDDVKNSFTVFSQTDKDKKSPLVEGKDYIVSYQNGLVKGSGEKAETTGTDVELNNANITNAGKYSVTITGINGYTGQTIKTVNILPAKTANIEITKDIADKKYIPSGVILAPDEIEVTDKTNVNTVLKQGVDYKVTYANNKVASDIAKKKLAKITVTFLGNYAGHKAISKEFVINKASPEDIKVYASDMTYTKPALYKAPVYVEINNEKVAASEYSVKYYLTYDENDESKCVPMDNSHKVNLTGDDRQVKVIAVVSGNNKNIADGKEANNSVLKNKIVTFTVKKADVDLSKMKVTIYDNTTYDKTKGTYKGVAAIEYTGKEICLEDMPDYSKITPENKEARYYIDIQVQKKDAKGKNIFVSVNKDQFTFANINNVKPGQMSVLISSENDTYAGTKLFNIKILPRQMGTIGDASFVRRSVPVSEGASL